MCLLRAVMYTTVALPDGLCVHEYREPKRFIIILNPGGQLSNRALENPSSKYKVFSASGYGGFFV